MEWVKDNRYDLGDMGFTGFTPEELAEWRPGWYFMNGDYFPNTSKQAIQLNKLPTDFKERWGIINNGSATCVPNFFYEDGRGYFVRAADGTIKKVGSVQEDAMRPITGRIGILSRQSGAILEPSGAFIREEVLRAGTLGTAADSIHGVGFDSALLGANYSGSETAPIHIGMTPVIYLGV